MKTTLEAPLTQAYLWFLSSALPIINVFNKLMQRESPLLHVLQQELNGFVRKLLLRFMKPDYVLSFSSALEVDINNEHFLPLDEVFLGDATLQYLESTDEISASDLRKFRETCLCWWSTAAKEALKRLPMQHSLLSNIQWLQPSLQQYSLVNQVQASAKLLPQVIKVDEIHILMEEFMDYCISPLSPDMKSITEVDQYWHAVSKIRKLTGAMRYPMLSTLAKAILVIPHGNADTSSGGSRGDLRVPWNPPFSPGYVQTL